MGWDADIHLHVDKLFYILPKSFYFIVLVLYTVCYFFKVGNVVSDIQSPPDYVY